MHIYLKQTAALLLAFLLAASCSACGIRQRVMETEAPQPVQTPPDEQQTENEAEPDDSVPSLDDPDSEIREYKEDASGVAAEDAQAQIASEAVPETETVQPAAQPAVDPPAQPAVQPVAVEVSNTDAELAISVTVPSDDAEKKRAADNDNTAESVMQYYLALLDSRLADLFECQRYYIYWERPDDYATVQKASAEHKVILLSGAYDVSSKLAEDALTVDDGWVIRKNPGAIVKCVPDASIAAAGSVLESVCSREGWSAVDAVKNRRLIALPESLLSSAAGQTAAAVYIACSLYPSLLGDVDPDQASYELLTEAGLPVPPSAVKY